MNNQMGLLVLPAVASATSVVPSMLDRLKAKLADENSSCISDAPGFFTFRTFIMILCKAENECYANYMEGAKALHYWMTNEQEPLLFPFFPSSEILPAIPRLLRIYETYELVKIITGGRGNYETMEDYLATMQAVESFIAYEILRNIGVIA